MTTRRAIARTKRLSKCRPRHRRAWARCRCSWPQRRRGAASAEAKPSPSPRTHASCRASKHQAGKPGKDSEGSGMALATRRTATAVASGDLAIPEPAREFAFSDADFRALAQFAYEHAGIALSDSKRNLVYSRLSRRLRALGLTSFRQYRDHLAANASEREGFLNAISTNLTKFFREAHHFYHFRTHVAAPFAQRAGAAGARRLRVWSAGCSTGEEPYTIAIVLKREMDEVHRH